MSSDATFYTVSDAGFFPGTVALLNSLRLTGHQQEIVVLDNGLTADQRDRLARHVSVVELERDVTEKHPMTVKPFPFLAGATGTVVLIDSDMIVSASLEPALALAAAGHICLYPDHEHAWDRWFPEWEELLSLSAPPRRQIYLNSGFLAFSADRWPWLLERWWNACTAIPPELISSSHENPFREADQDVLNAILMSEVEQTAIRVLPYRGQAHPDADTVAVKDVERLVCVFEDQQVSILHHSLRPKVWSRAGRVRLRIRHPYVRLFTRVGFGRDVELRLGPADVPWWVRPGFGYALAREASLLPRRVARPLVHLVRRSRAPGGATRSSGEKSQRQTPGGGESEGLPPA